MAGSRATAFVDAYAVLGVPASADAEALKAAHRRLVRRHHPDLLPPEERPAATRRVQEINVAYGLVRDPAARAAYDRVRRVQLARQAGAQAAGAASDRVAAADRQAAAQWDALARTAGRWAGRWWRRNRLPIARAARRGGRVAVDAAGRVLWLLSCVLGFVAGYLAATVAQRLTGIDGVVTPLVGALGGLAVGNQRGWHRRLRLARLPVPARAARVSTALLVAGLGLGLLVDWRW